MPKFLITLIDDGVHNHTLTVADPAMAPKHCATTYRSALIIEIRPAATNPAVTAGLMWHPLTCPSACEC